MTTADVRAHPSDALSRRQLTRAVLASTIGTTVEWYDWAIYAFAAGLYLGRLYFPNSDPFLSTLAAFGSFFVGFAARPLGAMIFGHFGDRIGRKAALIATLSLMGVATFLIGLTPTYAEIGVWAGLILVVLRVVQGISAGGEWAGSVLLTVEWGSRGRRGFWGSWPQVGVPAAIVLGYSSLQVFTLLLGPGSYWGWRIPFLLSIVMVGIGLYIRLGILETPIFAKLLEERRIERLPVVTVLRTSWREVVLTCLLRTSQFAPSYIITTFILTYAVLALKLNQVSILNYTLIAGVVSLVTTPFFGFLSDVVGRKRLYMLGAAAMFAWALPFWSLLDTRVPVLMFLAIVVAFVVHDVQYGPQATFIAETFTGRLRYSGASLGYHLAALTAGGPAPAIALALLHAFGSSLPIALYMMACAAVGFIAAALLRERSRQDMSVEYDERVQTRPSPVRA